MSGMDLFAEKHSEVFLIKPSFIPCTIIKKARCSTALYKLYFTFTPILCSYNV